MNDKGLGNSLVVGGGVLGRHGSLIKYEENMWEYMASLR